MSMNRDEFFEISRQLEIHHAVFYRFWEMGQPYFTNEIKTAAVSFDPKTGKLIRFLFNKDFWDSLTPDNRLFIICHEALHIVLEHGRRAIGATKQEQSAANMAMDVVINHSLVERFGFKKDDTDPDNKYCWIETVYPDKKEDIEKDRSFEYYYNNIDFSSETIGIPSLVDDHSGFTGMSDEDAEIVISRLGEQLSQEDKNSIKDFIEKQFEDKKDKSNNKEAGDNAGTSWVFMDPKVIPKKKKWETIIHKWAKPFLPKDFEPKEQWLRISRRWTNISGDIILPSEMEVDEKEEEGKIDVFFFLDTSGSCAGLSGRFWNAAKSLPSSRFNKRLFCFDTKVYSVNEKDGKLYGFGGTRFDIIEQKIQEIMSTEKCKYPLAVFVITDGYGNHVTPKVPKNWYWFLTEYGYKNYINKMCNLFSLKDFE